MNVNGIFEVIDKICGIFIEFFNVQGLVDGVCFLFEDKNVKFEFEKNVREKVKK